MPVIRAENYPHAWAIYAWRNPGHNEDSPRASKDEIAGGLLNWRQEFAYTLRNAAAAAGVPGIDSPDLITVVFGGEQVVESDKTLVIFVEALFDRPERTKEIRDHLAKMLGTEAVKHVPSGWNVEVSVKRFNAHEDSFWAS